MLTSDENDDIDEFINDVGNFLTDIFGDDSHSDGRVPYQSLSLMNDTN